MHEHDISEATRIRDHHADLFRTERSCLADLLVSVGDFESRGLHLILGYASIFQYLHRALAMSKGMAHYRMVGSRLVRRFPEVEQPIRDGRLCLTTVIELARVMTDENRAEVLPRFFGLSRQEAKEVAAEVDPAKAVPRRTVVSAVLPVAAPASLAGAVASMELTVVPGPAHGAEFGSTVEPDPTHPGRAMPMPESRVDPVRTSVQPLTATVSRLHITVSREFLALLKKARAGESHRNPGATDEQILKLALEALIEKQSKRKASVPAKVKREVVKRDEGRCQWKFPDGSVCGATARLEIDHVVPRGKGGPSTIDNCRVLCRGHDLEAARRAYGDAVMDLFTRSTVPGRDAASARGSVAGEAVAEYAPARPALQSVHEHLGHPPGYPSAAPGRAAHRHGPPAAARGAPRPARRRRLVRRLAAGALPLGGAGEAGPGGRDRA